MAQLAKKSSITLDQDTETTAPVLEKEKTRVKAPLRTDLPALNVYFPTPWCYKSDSDIESITRILELNGQEDWARAPRLFSILRMIDRLDKMCSILEEGISDFWLPLEAPPLDVDKDQFIKAQEQVLTRKFSATTKWPYRGHLSFHDRDVPLQHREFLGRGGYANVDRVYDYSGQRTLARKLIRRRRGEFMHQFEEEIKITKRLFHRHCIEFVGSYTTEKAVGLLMLPVADGNLWDILCSVERYEQSKFPLYQSWIGCLASALLYLHNNNIRHADIKPQNVLVAGDTVFITDFGISLDWVGQDPEAGSESDTMTRKYAAPERHGYVFRGSADVWSLGCAFLEILNVLEGAGFNLDNRCKGSYSDNVTEITLYLQYLSGLESPFIDSRITGLTERMLAYHPEDRPTANQVASELRIIAEDSSEWCGSCCIPNLTDDNNAREGLHHFVVDQGHFTEIDVQYISRELAFNQMFQWSPIPRTYIVLRLMDRMDLMPIFLQAGVSDIWFPYDKQLIRQLLRDPRAKEDFLARQNAVLSVKLMENEHQYFLDGDDYLQEIRRLGSGGFGSVWHCFDPEKGRHVAKKLIPRVRILLENRAKDAADLYEKELAILRRVSVENHPHLIRMVGSYTDLNDFAILFSPVAEMNLETYLNDVRSKIDLKQWFGCLATALQYLHHMKIRHKDVKPQNCLVIKDNIMLTDFGISHDWASNSRPTTSGPGARDPRYCAPEVADWEARNESADIWSLGCVFLEMFSTLKGFSVSQIRQHFKDNGTSATWYHKNEEGLRSLLKILFKLDGPAIEDWPIFWIALMTRFDKDGRITSDELVDWIIGGIIPAGKLNAMKVKLDFMEASNLPPSESITVGSENNRFCGQCCVKAYRRAV